MLIYLYTNFTNYFPQDVAVHPSLSQCETDNTDNELDRSVELRLYPSDDDSLIVSEVY